MAANRPKQNTFKNTEKEKSKRIKFNIPLKDKRITLSVGLFFVLFAFFLLVSLLSYLFTWQADQSVVDMFLNDESIIESGREISNWLGLSGAVLSHYFVFKWFGLGAFLIPGILFLRGMHILGHPLPVSETKFFTLSIFTILWLGILLGYVTHNLETPDMRTGYAAGGIGHSIASGLASLIGWGTYLFLIFSLLTFVIFFFNITSLKKVQNDESELSPSEENSEGRTSTRKEVESDRAG